MLQDVDQNGDQRDSIPELEKFINQIRPKLKLELNTLKCNIIS